ncbi:FIST C-terminal domain-containing protein [Bradyrhizobium genosp. L]|uniref:FIST N-terminal domain-containing protein n=1 Tax=Bradyrhizobium genosp. L TaxID=83637 RepID=UPI0018A2A277|nr:FIST N-terminal domain-containing protein [Bradyrhizobium genosp. L]QPF85237.1 FIST C-terminal domain-containing protein [Bradyrhizobium genosp. L]
MEAHGSAADSIVVAQAKTTGPRQAADEIARQLATTELAMVTVFVSPFYDPEIFIAELSQRLPDTPIFGCTTAGELTPGGWDEDSVVAMGFNAADFMIAARPLFELSTFRVDRGRSVCTELQQEFAQHTEDCDLGHESFGLMFIDGMCQREETLMSAIYASLGDIPIVGGSAGDGLRFEKSWVFHRGKAYTDAAVLILVRTRLPFRLFKCDHFEPTSTKMVVTEADIERRIVKEINAEPAALEYSRAVGLSDSKLELFSFAAHPLLVRVGGSYYARSIQRTNPDGSLQFFCAIDEGMVLTVARERDPVEATSDLLEEISEELGDISVFIGFECVLRRLDVEQHQLSREMSELYRRNKVVGFQTYGEQYRSMHVNQTLTGVAIGKRTATPR